MPPTLPSIGPGLKFDEGKVRTDLLPAGAVLRAMAAPHVENVHAQIFLWRRGDRTDATGHARLAIIAAALLRRLATELGVDHVGPALVEVAKVLTFGAKKYGPNNWQNVAPFEDRYYAALLRHLFAVDGGETHDAESGLRHLAHAACCALFLLSGELGHDAVTELSE